MYAVPPPALPVRRLLGRVAELDLVVLALLGWAAVEPWGLGVADPAAEALSAVAAAAPLLARRSAPGAAAAATLGAVLVQWTLGAGAPPLHASVAAALVAGYVLGGIAVASPAPALAVAGGFLLGVNGLAELGAGGWGEAAAQSRLTFAGVLLGGFAIGFFPGHRAARAAALRAEVAALERELAAELRAAAAAERAAIAAQLEQLLARVTRRAVPSAAAEDDREQVALALQRTERAARAASGELRRLLDVLHAPARPATPS